MEFFWTYETLVCCWGRLWLWTALSLWLERIRVWPLHPFK